MIRGYDEAAELERKLKLRVELKATRGIIVTVDEERERLRLWNLMQNHELAALEFDKRGMILARSLPARLRKDEDMDREEKAAKRLTSVAEQVVLGEGDEPIGQTLVTMKLDDDVIAFFKAGGRGYQQRINAVLKRIVREGADRWLGAE